MTPDAFTVFTLLMFLLGVALVAWDVSHDNDMPHMAMLLGTILIGATVPAVKIARGTATEEHAARELKRCQKLQRFRKLHPSVQAFERSLLPR